MRMETIEIYNQADGFICIQQIDQIVLITPEQAELVAAWILAAASVAKAFDGGPR